MIIGVGFQKTGTSSLREALKMLDYRVKDTSKRALIPILRTRYHRLKQLLKGYDAVEDTPWYMAFRELDELFPGSKFILTTRDEESWYRSVSEHIGDRPAAVHEWIYGRGKGLPKYHRENSLEVYRKHNETVLEYFKDRPGDLLVMNITTGEGWEALCPFLGRDIPETTFPHANRTSVNKEGKNSLRYKMKMRRQYAKNRLKITFISLMGWW